MYGNTHIRTFMIMDMRKFIQFRTMESTFLRHGEQEVASMEVRQAVTEDILMVM